MSEDLFIHQALPPEDIHAPYSFVFDTNDERLNSILPTASDVGKLAYVNSDKTIWMLVGTEPLTWKECLTGDSGTKPVGPALGDLQGEFPYPSVIPDSHVHTPGVSIPAYPVTLPPSGPAGGHLSGSYPNPSLVSSGVVSGIYINPTITVDRTGRITSATSKEAGETNIGENLGSGTAVYSHKEDRSLLFKTLLTEPHSGLSLTGTDETVNLDSPGLAKTAGDTFTGPVIANTIEADSVESNILYSSLYDAGQTTTWVPDARNGMVQRVTLTGGSILIDSILFSQPGMQFTFFLYQADQVVVNGVFADAYKFGKGKTKTLSQTAYTTDVLKVTIMSPTFYYAELIKDVR